jgi:hypothetical protein
MVLTLRAKNNFAPLLVSSLVAGMLGAIFFCSHFVFIPALFGVIVFF